MNAAKNVGYSAEFEAARKGRTGRPIIKSPVRGDDNVVESGGGSIPPFGDWNRDPSLVDNYTVVFDTRKKERIEGAGDGTPIRNGTIHGLGNNQQQQKEDFFTRICRCFKG